MKAVLFVLCVLFLSWCAAAQTTNAWPSACGPREARFSVHRDWYLSKHFSPATPAGEATIYFIQSGYSVVIVGIDGAWVGASKDGTWFAATVAPGMHHICEYANMPYWQSVKLSDIDAQPGESYYFRAQVRYGYRDAPNTLKLEKIDGHDGSRLIAKYPLSVFQEKK